MKIPTVVHLTALWAVLTFHHLGAASSPLDTLQPGEWYEAANTPMQAVKPNPLPAGNSGIQSVMSAWSGAAYDTSRDRLVVWGGGHGDYSGNELYVFSIGSMSWTRLTEPTPAAQIPTGAHFETYLDGLPSSRHTYGGMTYIPTQDRLFARNGACWQIGSNTIALWEFDFGSSSWARKTDSPEASYGTTSAWDPNTQHVFSMGNYKFVEYDPVADSWTTRYNFGGGMWNNSTTADIDPVHKRYVLVGGGIIRCYDLTTYAISTPVTTGDKTLESANNPGFQWDPVAQKFVGWMGGTDVYTLDPVTWVWVKVAAAGTNTVTPTSANATGTYGRFRYIPAKNCYILVNHTNDNVFFYKLGAGGGTVNQAPVIGSPITATPNPVVNQNTTALTVTASDPDNAPTALTFTWSKVSGPGTVTFAHNGTTAASVTTATFSASGTYSIQVTVSDGAASVNDSLTGLAVTLATPPGIATPPGNQAVTSGQTATFTMTASGSSPFTYQWQKNGSDIAGATAASYTTPATLPSDNGATYRVIVTNAFGSVTSGAATLMVTAAGNPIVVSVGALNLNATVGSSTPATATFSVMNSGPGAITVAVTAGQSWLAANPATGVAIAPGGTTTFTVTADPTGLAGTFAGTLTLTNSPGGAAQTLGVTFQVHSGTGGGGSTAGGMRRGGCTVGACEGGANAGWVALLLAGVVTRGWWRRRSSREKPGQGAGLAPLPPSGCCINTRLSRWMTSSKVF